MPPLITEHACSSNRATRDSALALAIIDGVLDERDIPRYANAMTGDAQIMAELAASTRNELAREQRQREWLKKKGVQ